MQVTKKKKKKYIYKSETLILTIKPLSLLTLRYSELDIFV